MIIVSQHLVPRDSESPAVPPQNFAFFGGRQKNFRRYSNVPIPSPENLHQVSANGNNSEIFLLPVSAE